MSKIITGVQRINADTLGGKKADEFAPSGFGVGEHMQSNGIADSNLATTTGMYYAQGNDPNKPSGVQDGSLFVTSYSSQWVNQMYFDWRTNKTFRRKKENGTWSAWVQLLDSTSPILGLSGTDTRSANYNPSEYMQGGIMYVGVSSIRTEFKSTATIGVTSQLSGDWCQLITYSQYPDVTGGYPHQMAIGTGGIILMRSGTSLTTWSTWTRLLDSSYLKRLSNDFSWGTTSGASGWYKIKIKSVENWMLCFKLTVYQDYNFFETNIMGYWYGVSHWYSPRATLISKTFGALPIHFGYDADLTLWVAFPAGNYTGLNISNIVNGYYPVTKPWHEAFEVINEQVLTGTIQQTFNL